MTKIRIFLLYTVCAFVALAFFIYYLFPSDAVKAYVTSELKNANPDFSMTIDQIRPGFPPGFKCKDIMLFQKDIPMIHADWMKIFPDFLTLLGSEKRFIFKGESHEGHFDGHITLPPSSEKKNASDLTIRSELSEIQVREISGIQDRSDNEISGILGGTITYGGKDSEGAVNAKLTLADCNIGLAEPIFSVETLTFDTIDADVEIKEKKVQIRQCVTKGKQVGGNFSGIISLKEPFEKSMLNLSGSIKPHPSFIANLGEGAALLLKQGSGADGFPFSIRGTFESPQFSLE